MIAVGDRALWAVTDVPVGRAVEVPTTVLDNHAGYAGRLSCHAVGSAG